MRAYNVNALGAVLAVFFAASCASEQSAVSERLAQYATVRLTADLSTLSDRERDMIPLLIDAAEEMDDIFWTDIFWTQAYGNRDSLLESITDPATRSYVEINYGPWDRLAGDEPFLPGFGPKARGANLYPPDLTRQQFEVALDASAPQEEALRSLYTLVRRGPEGDLTAVPYHEAFAEQTARASAKLKEAAALADDAGLRRYLELRADALLADDYRESSNNIDVVIGPIETYEDQLFGYKAAHEAYVLIKDREWSQRLSQYTRLLPGLQQGLPVPAPYKRETPGRDSDLNAYDVIYYAGDANAGSKTIAINLPNDESVQLEKGTRRLQLKNAMQAKFDSILVPIAEMLIAPEQQGHITFDAFFANTMFHEVAHGLGVKNTINGRGTVREAMREHYSPMEEGKADVLGLYMVTQLFEQGVLTEGDVRDNYVTFVASIFRSVRFGASSAHGRANMVRFNFFEEQGAFTRDAESGTYRVDFEQMKQAMTALSEVIITLQGDGDHAAAGELLAEEGQIGEGLQADLDRLAAAGIPVDIVFEQGMTVLQ
jgi:hypothetical protein